MIAQKLITVGENENTVFRSCKDGIHTNVFETICAFLNTRGGTLLLGVDESGEVYGFKERAIPDIIQALKMATQNADTFQPPFEMEPVREIVDGKYVLVLNVPESANVHALRGKIFVRRGTENIRVERKEDYLKKYFFLRYLYSGKEEDFVQLEKLTDETEDDVSQFSRMVLVSASNGFFETEEEHFLTSLKEEVQREFYYVNLNSNESIFLFPEKYTDYHVVVEKMYRFFAHQFDSECYFAVSKEIEDRKNLAEEFKALEGMLEEQFYQPHQHLFFHGEKQEEKKADPAEDSEIMEQITNDIQYKDLPHLRQDFQKLEDKYRANKQFSDMYVKFVFSGILKELLDQMDEMDEKMLSKRVDRLYRCKNLKDVIAIVDEALQEYEHCIQEQEDGFRSEITKVKSYIYHHYQERNLGAETLSAMVFLSPGYLSAVFKEETGVTLNRFIREVRMEKAKELLETTNMKISGIAKEVGFSNNSYFCRSFREFFGDTPEACRKGTEADEKTNTEAAPSI